MTIRISRRALALGALAAAATATSARADRPWGQYLRMRDDAPELLEVTVASVSDATTDETVTRGPYSYRQQVTRVRAQLSVLRVTRSASRLRGGETIDLSYEIVIADTGLPSQFPPRLLKQGERVLVYLRRKGAGYELAAGKASFE